MMFRVKLKSMVHEFRKVYTIRSGGNKGRA